MLQAVLFLGCTILKSEGTCSLYPHIPQVGYACPSEYTVGQANAETGHTGRTLLTSCFHRQGWASEAPVRLTFTLLC